MPATLTKEKKEKLLELFEIPEEFYPWALKMLSLQEIELILLMEKRVIPEAELLSEIEKAGLAKAPKTLIDAAYQRYVITKVLKDDGVLCYEIDNFYGRYPYYAQFEPEEYYKFPEDVKKRLNDWDFEIYYSRYGDDVKAKMAGKETYVHNSDYLTLEEADAFLEKHKDSIYRVPCNCKCMMDVTHKPRNVCINFYDGINSPPDRGHGQKLTLEHAKELIRYYNSQGLMQNGEDFAICNCDGESCYPLQMARKAGARGVYPKSHYTISHKEEECINCGKCVNICNFGAFEKDGEGKVHFNKDKCWGCTICSANCPKKAIELIKN